MAASSPYLVQRSHSVSLSSSSVEGVKLLRYSFRNSSSSQCKCAVIDLLLLLFAIEAVKPFQAKPSRACELLHCCSNSFLTRLMANDTMKNNSFFFILRFHFALNCILSHAYAGYNVAYLIFHFVSTVSPCIPK